jgi:hypothetical protein
MEAALSDTQFSRADWRPGGRRKTVPRKRSWGGQKVAPVAFRAAAKFAGLHTHRAKRCTATALSTGRTCRRVAMGGSDLCLVHGGALAAKRNRPYVPTGHGQRIKAEIEQGGYLPGPKRALRKGSRRRIAEHGPLRPLA